MMFIFRLLKKRILLTMKKMKKTLATFVWTLTLAASLGACGGQKAGKSAGKVQDGELSGKISLSGAFALYPLTVKWADDFKKLHPDVKIDISAGGAGKGITDALSDVVDLGMVSRELAPDELKKGAVAFPVAKDAVVATINAKNPNLKAVLEHGLTREAAIGLWITGIFATAATALARDTVFATVMLILNGVVGMCLLIGAWRHHVLEFRAEGTTSPLSVLATLAALTLVLPSYTSTTPGPTAGRSACGWR